MPKRQPPAQILWDVFPDRDGPDVYWVRHQDGATPICKVSRAKGGWELLFFRGPANPGPHFYRSFEQLKRHLDGYLRGHGEKLVGPAKPLYVGEFHGRPGLVPDPPIVVAKRRQRRPR